MLLPLNLGLKPNCRTLFSSIQFIRFISFRTLAPPALEKKQANEDHLCEIALAAVEGDVEDEEPEKGNELNIQQEAAQIPSPAEHRSSKTKTARIIARRINNEHWSLDLESSLSLLCPSLSKTSVLQTLHLIRTPHKAVRFFKWAQDHGFAHNDQTYFKMLEILGHSRNLNAARNFLFSIEKRSGGSVKLQDRFFNSLIRSYGQAGLIQESIKVFSTMKSLGVSPSVVTFNSLLSVLLRRGRTNMAQQLYHEMLSVPGVSPDVCTFNILIRGFCLNSMLDEGFRFFKEMSRFRCDPDIVTYNTLIDGLCRAGKVRIAHNLLKGLLAKSPDLYPNIVTYTTLIRGYCEKHAFTEALAVYEEMLGRGMKPNSITYNTLIQGLCDAQKLEKIKEILEGMIGGGEFLPDTCTFNTLMTAHCNAGKLDEAMKMFEKMSELKIPPDSTTYSVLIRSLCQRTYFDRAEELFDDLLEKEILVRDVGCVPLVAAYNPMFVNLCGSGKTAKAEKVFRQLLKRGTQDPSSFKTLIMGHCKEGTLQAGYDLLVLMLRRDFVPDFQTYDSLIEGFLHKGEAGFAQKTLEKMLKSSHLPRTSTFHSVLAALVKESCVGEVASFVLMMLERNIRPTIHLFTDTTIFLFKNRLRDAAFEVVGSLYDKGYSVKMEELVGFLCGSSKFLDARELLLFSLERRQGVDIEIYSAVITGLCRIYKASEAFGLYHALTEKQGKACLSCLGDLKICLETEGKVKEAEFVHKRMHCEEKG
ncbi:pentatricopeptide repeat-containing protein At1g02060, chloroplastic [Telopea speciosissima]|uniref:pentatricopeptide repeat-containing protein At1g02060, chloroplastic n=1 Tax=Telopea speciosissima TaxID=54955 RepID=UPI001CC521A3|nr:pentatricopeptide repeat-containing protein At1g02060, chloroplastic [Telopea speciosissima]